MNRFTALLGTLLLLAACGGESATPVDGENKAAEEPSISFFSAAHLIPGDGSAPIEEAIMITNGGKVTQVGKKGDFPPPKGGARIDLKEQTGTTSATVLPALINIDAYPGLSNGPSFGVDNYKRENFTADLNRYEYYGVAAVAGGGADTGDLAFQVREEQRQGKAEGATYYTSGQGITAKGGYPSNILKGVPLEVSSEADARKAVTDLAAKKVDFIKVFVNGSPKLSPELYTAIIDEAKKANLKVFADAPAAADAKGLVDAGVTALVNSITDGNVDDALIAAMKAKNVIYAPALTNLESKFVYADQPKWLGEQFMREVYPAPLMAYLSDAVTVNRYRRNAGLPNLRAQYKTAQSNLKKLADGGVKIALGTGTGMTATYPGYFEHRELELMVDAGMSPADAIKAATAGSAEALGLADHGALADSKAGDFIVTANNPLEDITNTKSAQQIYRHGSLVDQGALIQNIKIDVPKITQADRQADARANADEDLRRRIEAMPHYGPWPMAPKSAQIGGLAIPIPYSSTSSVSSGKVTINYRGSASDWRAFYTAALARAGWKAAGNCWEKANVVSKKTATACVEPGGSSAVIQITEK